MTLYASTIPPEQLRLAMDTAKALHTARTLIEARNYGLADEYIVEALTLLPADYGEGGIGWPALEDRTSA